jgi:cytochrome c biogenesis protein CcmG/thiol:disulfide interchange protein DsbE
MMPSDELEKSAARSRIRKQIVVGIALALIVGVIAFLAVKPAPQVEQSVPEFSLPLLSGDGELASSDLEGKPVVINFWASWCEPCKKELPAFQELYERYQDEVEFVGINMKDDLDDAKAMADEFGLTYPLVVGTLDLEDEFRLAGYPQTFFVTADYEFMDSTVQASEGPILIGQDVPANTSGLGGISKAELESEIERLLD